MREYIRYFTQEKKEPFVIEISGKSWCDGGYRIVREDPKQWIMEYILSGRGVVRVGAPYMEYRPEAGSVYLLSPHRKHEYFSGAEDPWIKIFLNFRGSVVNGLAEAYGLAEKIYFPDVTELEGLFVEIYELMKDRELPDKYVLEQTELLVHQIFRGLGKKIQREKKETDEIGRVKQYLDEHVGELVTIQEMSELIYRSPDYLIKHFKAEVGVTPYQYLLKRKMMIAERLLRDTTLPVKEVAEQLGYEDAHYFSGLFKREKKVSPSRFRKEI